MKIRIGEMAEMMGVSNQTLQYYDRIGLLEPDTDPVNGYRYYNQFHCWSLDTIISLKNAGMSLGEINAFLKEHDTRKNAGILEERIDAIERKILMLENIRKQLESRTMVYNHYNSRTERIGFIEFDELHVAEIRIPPGSDSRTEEQHLRRLLRHVKKLEHQFIVNIIVTKDVNDIAIDMTSEPGLKSFAVPLNRACPESPYYTSFPAGLYAYTFHEGNYPETYRSTSELLKFIEAEGF